MCMCVSMHEVFVLSIDSQILCGIDIYLMYDLTSSNKQHLLRKSAETEPNTRSEIVYIHSTSYAYVLIGIIEHEINYTNIILIIIYIYILYDIGDQLYHTILTHISRRSDRFDIKIKLKKYKHYKN